MMYGMDKPKKKAKQSQPAVKRRIRVNQQVALKQKVKSINDYFNSLKGY
jgi:hypothetical protein